MASRSLLLVVLIIGSCSAWLEERPILESQDGNLVIASAKDRNITLMTFGKSTVNINDINLLDVSIRAHDAARIVENWENGHLLVMTRDLNRIVAAIEGPNGLQRRLRNLERGVDTNFTGRPGRSNRNRINDPLTFVATLRNLTRRVRNIENTLNTMRDDLLNPACASDPCGHGGTCIRIYNGYQCLCPPNWEGPNCNDDVNECANFAGTDLGCQNGATCVNFRGGYRCNCASGWHGIHCRTKSNACDVQDSRELCGFGTCVPKAGSALGYTCICDAGWQSSGTDPACTTDVDECAGKHPACSMNPFVPCLNLPGSYRCAMCPPGYTGNGHYCTDIDECAVDNGGCSLTPRVQCINTVGSSNCGPCPAGYQGNGKTCTFVGLCGVNNGGCHPLATCVENTNYNNLYPQCNCPSGYHGHGIGPQGCVPGADTTNPCSNNRCVHGTCRANGALYTCHCNPGFTGTHCEVAVNPCTPNPCLNEGVCKSSDSQTISCECTSKFMGPRCETARQACGGLFKNPSGVLEYPTTGGNYAHDLNCAFVILTNTSRVLNITFTRFGFEKSQNCRYDFLQIHDGANAGAHQMGRFCGSALPLGGKFVTTHNAVYLWLRTDSTASNQGFALHWNSVFPSCGGFLTGDHGRISSPGSPGRYPNNRDCIWEVMTTPGKRIQFHFFSVMMEEHPTCENDYLEINETTGDRSIQLGLYCNHTHPMPLTTSGSEATLHFHSDGAGNDMGFQISYTTIEGIPGCGGIFTSPKGTISSPGYPSNYPSRMLCEWKIQLPKNERLRLTWIGFDLEVHRACHFDSLKVFAGPDTSSPIVGTYCGKTLPAQVTIDSNEALIVFRSDWSNQHKGFQLEYETICGGQFHEASGVIQSPYYPNSYPASRTCIYEIIQPPGKAIVLAINDLDIESGFHESCYFDSLSIYDGDNDNSTLLAQLCGDHQRIPSEPFYSTHNFMYLKFVTDSSMNNRGFSANYTTVDRRCGGLLKTPSGVIQSHTGSTTYDDNEACTWTIKAPPGHIVQLTFTSFNLEMGYHCLSDYVIVYDGSSTSGQELGRFCGPTMPPALMTQSESMSVVFKTDNDINAEGFIAHYVFIDASKVCGGHFYSETGVINSPNYPESYPANRECVWVITAANKHQIQLEVVEFELEEGSRCSYDYLEIRNGGYETSPLIDRYCGTKIPHSFKSLTNELYIKLVTDASRHRGGFSLKWDSSTSGCGGTLSGSRGEIISPKYPQPYSRLASCVWKIAVAAGSKVQLIMVDFDIEDHMNCRYDYLEVTSGNHDPRKKPTRYCGTNVPPYIDVDSNIVSLRFRSDYTNAGRGFHIRYETLCVSKIRGFDGIIESPNFPNNYLPSTNCSWTIEAPEGNTLNLTFSHFDLEPEGPSGTCTNDYLTIKEGTSDEPNTDLATLCGSENLPARISSQQNQLFINFTTNRYVNNAGFRLEWTVVGCGGHLTSPTGEITSPGYPNAYKTKVECEWLIETDFDQSIEITLEDINLEKVAGCRYDKVTLYGGADESAPKLVELCHTEKPIKYTSPTNKLFVKFISDFSFSGRGFKATYKSVDILCGGKFSAPSGLIHSANFPLNYPNNQNCEWLIQVDRNTVVNLTFTDFDIEDTTNCTDDYVKVFDGATQEDTLLGTFCKNVLPAPIISSGNSVLVVMRSDSLLTAQGFQARFTQACGARIIANGAGFLHTTSTLHTDEAFTNCTWTIIAEDPGDHVTLSFYHMDLGGSYSWDTDCDDHYVRLYEGDSLSGPVLGTWCGTKTPLPITSTGNAMTVHLYSEFGNTDDRFGAVYSVLNSACGGEYFSISGTIASPMYPESYPVNSECIWQLKTSPGNRIRLTFSLFEIETSPNCDGDYLEIREKSGIGPLIGIYCNEMPGAVEASTELWIKFRSDNSGTAKGFLGEYNLIHGNELTGVSGEIASPLYPLPWKQDLSITWRITVDFGMAVKIEFDDVHIENYGDYCASKIVIFDGYNDEAPELANVCGVSAPQEAILSTSNVLYIQFLGDSFREGNWFLLRWYQVPRQLSAVNTEEQLPDCVFEYDLTEAGNASVSFHSPGWPDGYDRNVDCSWIFTAAPGHHLRLLFKEIDLEATAGCVNDYVMVYDGRALPGNRDDVPVLNRFCHSNETFAMIVGKTVMTVNFRSDFLQNKTGFLGEVWRHCGGELFGPNGVIDFNETVIVYNVHMHRHTCEWNITVKAGRTISVNFPVFDVPNSGGTGCKDSYVLLKNGEGSHAPLLGPGRYCGETAIPTSLETTGNKLYVKAVGAPRFNFKMTYKEVRMACGGNYNLGASLSEQVEFSTPNYPNIPPPFTECIWTFRALHGERLSLHFIERFDLASTPNCTREYVEVRDGGTEHSKLLGTFCRDTAPSTMTTNSDMLYVHFYTDLADPKNGFKAAVTPGQVCGGILRGKTGVIKSPNYPATYPIDEVCGWWIVAPPEHTLKLEFRDINLPGLRRCVNTDYVRINERLPFNSTVNSLGVWCGSTKPDIPQTSSNEAIVTFNSDNRTTGNYRGFSLNYTATKDPCGGELSGTSGEFKSTGYPNPNTRSRYCDWTITVPEGSQVVVEILDLDVNSLEGGSSTEFYLAFYNDRASTSKITYLKSAPVNQKISSTANFMRIAYWIGLGHRGFKARFNAVAPAPCGGILENMSGALLPPPSPYNETSFFCPWKLRVPPSAIDHKNRTEATLTVSISGSIGNYDSRSSACTYRLKYIRVNDGEENVGVVCGNMTNEVYTVRSPSAMNMIDVLNGTFGPPISFDLRYEWKPCGGILTGPSHTIRTPINVFYPRSCVWHAKFEDTGSAMTLVFNRMSMGGCDKSFIIVRNGGPLSPQIGKFCGNIKPHNITSSMNQLWIEYWASEAPADFEIQLELVSRSCGGVIRGSNNEFSSPGFPKQYPEDAECTWEITAQPGFSIGLYFVNRFNLETSDSCKNDFVQIFEWTWNEQGLGNWIDGPKFCGRNTPPPVNTTSNRLKVLFRSNEAIQGDGFQAKWEQNCGGVFEATGRDQYIESPHYPNPYPPNRMCNYTIKAPRNKEIWIQFMDFDIEGRRQNCRFDNVTITTQAYLRGMKRETVWCGKTMPTLVNSLATANIVFMTDAYVQKRGFRFKYYTNECGGEITEPMRISPPSLNDKQYYGRLNCTWSISAPAGKSVVLRLEKFDLEVSHSCVYDRLLVFEGLDIRKDKQLAKLCGNITDLFPIKSTGNQMTVLFLSDASNHYGSMSASVSFTNSESSGCGGKINLTRSESFKTQKAALYDPYEDCQWRIYGAIGTNIKLTISRMDLKNANGSHTHVGGNCTGDYLEVRDAAGPLGDLIGRYCGNVIPPPIISSSNTMWIRLFTDDIYEGEGVVGTLEPVHSPCGKNVWEVNDTVVLASPNYPADYPAGVQCTWTFKSPQPYRKLRIHFEEVDMEDTEQCDGDRLEVSDQARKYINQDFGGDFVHNGNSFSRGPRRYMFGGDAIYKYCGKGKSFDYYSSTDDVRVTLRTNSENLPKPRKFKFDVSRASCNRNYTSEQGRIVHEGIAECWTTITALPNQTISLYFNDFKLYDLDNCRNNYVKIHDGDFSTPPVKTLCGFAEPSPVYSTGNKLSIHAKVDSERRGGYEKYDFLYTATDQGRGCGGKLFNYAGVFTSPMYPTNYRNDSMCIWEVSVPRGYQIALRFIIFDLGSSDRCSTDYVTVEETSAGQRFETYCGGEIPAIFRASGNSVKVTYFSSVNNAGTGWIVRFIALQSTDVIDTLPGYNRKTIRYLAPTLVSRPR